MPQRGRGHRRTLLDVLETLLRALHPLMPFITEEIWRRVAPVAGVAGEPIMLAPWPDQAEFTADRGRRRCGLDQARHPRPAPDSRRDGYQPRPSPGAAGAVMHGGRPRAFTRHAALLGRLAGIDAPRLLDVGEVAPPSASAVVGNMTLLVPMPGLIDPAGAHPTESQAGKEHQEIVSARAKLGNPNFVNHAPPDVVATERERIAQFEKVNESLARQIEIVQGLVLLTHRNSA